MKRFSLIKPREMLDNMKTFEERYGEDDIDMNEDISKLEVPKLKAMLE